MVTAAARSFWQERQRFTQLFLEHLNLDLGSEMEVPFAGDREALAFMEGVMRGRDLVPNRAGIIFPFRQRSRSYAPGVLVGPSPHVLPGRFGGSQNGRYLS